MFASLSRKQLATFKRVNKSVVKCLLLKVIKDGPQIDSSN